MAPTCSKHEFDHQLSSITDSIRYKMYFLIKIKYFALFFINHCHFIIKINSNCLTFIHTNVILYIVYIYNIIKECIPLDIIINNSSGIPIYEQIYNQLKSLIVTGNLKEGEALPSMRLLAKELRISVITTKRAYEELERDGLIETITGKGSFVGKQNIEVIREEYLKETEDYLNKAIESARHADMSLDDLTDLLKILYEFE